VDIGASGKLELVDKFYYPGDMLSVDGDADAAVVARIRIGWNKFRQLVPLLTNKDVSLIMRGRLYTVSQKKQDTKLLPITSLNVNRFSKFFHWQTHW